MVARGTSSPRNAWGAQTADANRPNGGRGALIPLRSPFVIRIRKKGHVIGIDGWSEPDHGFRKLAKPDIALLGFREAKIHRTYFSSPSPDESCSLAMLSSSLLSFPLLFRLSRPRILRIRRFLFVFVLLYRPTACPKGNPQSGTMRSPSR